MLWLKKHQRQHIWFEGLIQKFSSTFFILISFSLIFFNQAQIAANNKGIELIKQLINEYKLEVVLAYMKHIQNTAEQSVRNLMKELSAKNSSNPTDTFVHLKEEEYMDDGSIINLYVRINKSDGSALFDFTGTTYQVNGNSNAPRAITLSAIIYCLRCMLNYEIPLNQVENF